MLNILDYNSDNLFKYFVIEQNTGIICSLINNDLLSDLIVNSGSSYFDYYNLNTCYNLLIYASTRLLMYDDLKIINYDSKNCSFSYFKVCTNKMKNKYEPPIFSSFKGEKSIIIFLK